MKRHSDLYRTYMRSDAWRDRRRAELRAAGRRCRWCGRSGRLEVHHRTYRHLGAERPGDLVVLCRRCHRIADVLRWCGVRLRRWWRRG